MPSDHRADLVLRVRVQDIQQDFIVGVVLRPLDPGAKQRKVHQDELVVNGWVTDVVKQSLLEELLVFVIKNEDPDVSYLLVEVVVSSHDLGGVSLEVVMVSSCPEDWRLDAIEERLVLVRVPVVCEVSTRQDQVLITPKFVDEVTIAVDIRD